MTPKQKEQMHKDIEQHGINLLGKPAETLTSPRTFIKGAQNKKTMAFSKIYKELKNAVDRWSIADTWKTSEEREALKAYKYCPTQTNSPVTVYGAAKLLVQMGISIKDAAKLYEHVALCEILSLLSVSKHVGVVGSNSKISDDYTGVFQGEHYENAWCIWAGNIHPLYVGTFEEVKSFLETSINLQNIYEPYE